MWVARIFQGLIAGLILVGLFMLASTIFIIVIGVIIVLGIMHWLRSKGILADKKGHFRKYKHHEETYTDQNGDITIEAEYEEVITNKNKDSNTEQ